MPVRSIKLKLIVPRSSDAAQPARDLWTTHEAVNNAVKHYEALLLEMRGQDYLLRDGTLISETDIVQRLNERIKDACKRNGRSTIPNSEELASIRRDINLLYQAIVPSSTGDDGNAQQAKGYLSPLTDPDSQGFFSIFEKIGSQQPWFEGVRTGEAKAFDQAEEWLKTPEGKSRVSATGAPPTWVLKLRKGDKSWPVSFIEDYDRKLEEAKGVPTIIRNLKTAKVLPLFQAYLTQNISGARGNLSPWDRLAFRLAVGHLLSWESWGRKCSEEHAKRLKELEDFRTSFLDKEELVPAVNRLRQYESERHLELSKTGLVPVSAFRIRRRMIRSWTELRDRWKNAKDKNPEKLHTISAELQTKLKGAFGDPHLFNWLAHEENHFIWHHDSDVVTLVATANLLQSVVERSRERAFMTLPDPLLHPRSVQWEPLGGSNLKKYRLDVSGTAVSATLPLLSQTPDGKWTEIEHTFKLAPSRQFRNPVLSRNGKVISIEFQNQTGELLSGTLNSADLLFNWSFLANHDREKITMGHVGPAYFKMVVDIQKQLPEGWDGKRPRVLNHFSSAKGNNKYLEEVKPGLRILSADLGARTFASCSVFELFSEPAKNNKLCFSVEGNLWAVHERSFLLHLPDETVDAKGIEWRANAREDLRRLKRGLNRYRKYYGFTGLQNENDRAIALEEQLLALQEADGWAFEEGLIQGLKEQTGSSPEVWDEQVLAAMKLFRHEFGVLVREWRKSIRVRSKEKAMGKSMWAIEHLTDVRRFLVSWSLLGEHSGHIRRLDRAGRGSFAGRLLTHLEGVKDDRLKTGSDLLVQAARGFLRDDDGRWQKHYDPCHAILFEDLSRYRMKTDRPKRENSLLMKWSHRSVPLEVQMQGDLYGLYTCETSAAFSSRYHAATNTPGIRCHPIKLSDLDSVGLRNIVERENPSIAWDDLKAGDLVPLSGGELFVCLTPKGFNAIHADINAAQNLQRRFWTRHGDVIRIPCRKIVLNGEEYWLPKSIGKRLQGAMGGYRWLTPTGHDSGSCRWEALPPKKWRSLGGKVMEDDLTSDVEGIEEELLESTGEVIVFFRDPSGVVLPQNLWYPSKTFWSIVKTKTAKSLKS